MDSYLEVIVQGFGSTTLGKHFLRHRSVPGIGDVEYIKVTSILNLRYYGTSLWNGNQVFPADDKSCQHSRVSFDCLCCSQN
jgi:hypothetical protein